MTPSEYNTLCTVFWRKVFVLHSFSFAVTSCKVSRLLLLLFYFLRLFLLTSFSICDEAPFPATSRQSLHCASPSVLAST